MIVSGRGDRLVATLERLSDGSYMLRLDDERRPEFWAEVHFTSIDLATAHHRVVEASAAAARHGSELR